MPSPNSCLITFSCQAAVSNSNAYPRATPASTGHICADIMSPWRLPQCPAMSITSVIRPAVDRHEADHFTFTGLEPGFMAWARGRLLADELWNRADRQNRSHYRPERDIWPCSCAFRSKQ